MCIYYKCWMPRTEKTISPALFVCFKMRIHSKFLIFLRFDGFEQMAFIVGTALSPVLFRCAGYEGAFR